MMRPLQATFLFLEVFSAPPSSHFRVSFREGEIQTKTLALAFCPCQGHLSLFSIHKHFPELGSAWCSKYLLLTQSNPSISDSFPNFNQTLVSVEF